MYARQNGDSQANPAGSIMDAFRPTRMTNAMPGLDEQHHNKNPAQEATGHHPEKVIEWKPDCPPRAGKRAVSPGPTKSAQDCVDAFNSYEPESVRRPKKRSRFGTEGLGGASGNSAGDEGAIELTLNYDAHFTIPQVEKQRQSSPDSKVDETDLPENQQLSEYNGRMIAPPNVQLLRAKAFLTDQDFGRTTDWRTSFDELEMYLKSLTSNAQDECWKDHLEEAELMLATHSTFEKYHYQYPKLTLKFPPSSWPSDSRRLPRLPGFDMKLRAENEQHKNLTGPRQLLHVEVASAHDSQYGKLPPKMLQDKVLNVFKSHTPKFWGGGRAQSGQDAQAFNIVHHENSYYERCMAQGIGYTAKLLSDEGQLRNPLPRAEVTEENLKDFAQFRGCRRAALQQCLSLFKNNENHRMRNLRRAVALPAKPEPRKPDAGIVFTTMVSRPPLSDTSLREPWMYNWAHNWYKKDTLRWAQWTREHAIKEAYGHKVWSSDELPIMDVPKNYLGPVYGDLMDKGMRKTYLLLRQCQNIAQAISRASRQAPREFMSSLVEMVDSGCQVVDWWLVDAKFAAHEFVNPLLKNEGLLRLRPTEIAWLEYICQPSFGRQRLTDIQLSQRGEVLLARISELLADRSPVAFFKDMELKSVAKLLVELNRGCRGPVRRRFLTEDDVRREAVNLERMGIIRLSHTPTGLKIGRPSMDVHPEDLIRWSAAPALQPVPKYPQMRGGTTDSSVTTNSTISTRVDVSVSDDDFEVYPEGMPREEHVLSLSEYDGSGQNEDDQRKTLNFFRALSYRLGLMLRFVPLEHEANQKILRDPDRRDHNANLVWNNTEYWIDDTVKRPNSPKMLKRGLHHPGRQTLLYSDVINMADPENYDEKWNDEPNGVGNPKEIVRQNILLEAYENRNLVIPASIPFQDRFKNYRIPPEGSRRDQNSSDEERLDKDGRPKERYSRVDKKQGPQPPPKLGLLSVWSFAHPSRKHKTHLFWDINNWPLHLQGKEKQARIRSRGPKMPTKLEGVTDVDDNGGDDDNGDDDGDEKLALHGGERDMHGMTYADTADERRSFVRGSAQFLLGDTQLQRKYIEGNIRRCKSQTFSSGLSSREKPMSLASSSSGNARRNNDGAEPGNKRKKPARSFRERVSTAIFKVVRRSQKGTEKEKEKEKARAQDEIDNDVDDMDDVDDLLGQANLILPESDSVPQSVPPSESPEASQGMEIEAQSDEDMLVEAGITDDESEMGSFEDDNVVRYTFL